MPGWIRIVVLGGVLAHSLAAGAQDTPMTGRGNALVAVRSTEVGLEHLAIEFEFWPDAEAFRVKTQFELANHATREVHLQLGLPEPRCQSDSDEDDPCANPDTFRYESLASTSRGAPLPAQRGRMAPKHEWASAVGSVWLFDIRLRADERAAIEHRYIIAAAAGAGDAMEVTQIARAGAMWLEPIDTATLTFLLPIDSCLVVEPEQIKRRTRRVVLRGHAPWLELTYAAQAWAPTADLSLRFESCVPARDTQLTGCSLLAQLSAFAYAASPASEESSDPDPQNLIPSATAKPGTNAEAAPSAPAPAPVPRAAPSDNAGTTVAGRTRRTPFPAPRDPDPNPTPITRTELKARLVALPEAELKRCGQAVFDAWASYYSATELAILAHRPSATRHYAAPLLTPEDWQWVGLVDEAWAAQKKATKAGPSAKKAAIRGEALAFRSVCAGVALLLLTAAAWYGLKRRRTRARPPASDNRT